jgi:hypothetical protein
VPPSSHGLDLNCMLFIFTLFSRWFALCID